MRITIERCLIPTCTAILVVSSFLLFGCGEKAVKEKHVIEMTYNYLINKAEQLQGSEAKLSKGQIDWGFHSAVLDAMREAIYSDDGLGQSVEIYLDRRDKEMEARNQSAGMPKDASYKIPTSSNVLKMLAQAEGDGLWVVSINEWEFEYNERTGEVRARNNEATKLLEEITLKTYHNSRYGYYLDYPPSWAINELDEDKSRVGVFSSSLEAFVLIGVIEEEELAAYKGLQGYIEARLSSYQSQYHEFELTEVTPMRVDYTYMLREDAPRHEAKHYFVQHGSKVYEIVCSAVQPKFESLSRFYDPYNSFRFQP